MEFHYQSFFDLLQDCVGENVSLGMWMSEATGASESNAYRKITGERKLSVNELLKICAAEPSIAIKAAELFRHHQLKVVQLQGFQDAAGFHEYLLAIDDLLQKALETEEIRFRYFARDLPLFYFLGDADLLRHKFQLWLGGKHQDSLESKTIDLGKKLFHQYTQLPTEEIWHKDAFDAQYLQLENLQEYEGMDTHLAQQMQSYLEWLQKQQGLWKSRGAKSGGGELLMTESSSMLPNNGALVKIGKEQRFLGGINNVHYFYSENPSLILQFDVQWDQHLRWSKDTPPEMVYRQLRAKELKE